ncbi:MAG: glycosyltransferase, partial [Acidimicrobiia bacterium]
IADRFPAVRVLAACSLGGSGHLDPLLPFLAGARRRGDETLVVGPPSMQEIVDGVGHPFRAGGEPTEAVVAPIRERLPIASPEEASELGNRELFGRLATSAMLPEMERACREWRPDLLLRDPCEYASAAVAGRLGIRTAQVAISLAEAEWGSIHAAAPALEEHRVGLVDELLASPYLTRFPAALDPSPFPATFRFRERAPESDRPLPDWWNGSEAPLVYVTFGTVLGYMSMADNVCRMALRAVEGLDARVLLTVGRRFDRSGLGPIPANVHVETWVDQRDVLGHADLVVCHGGSGTSFGALAAGVPVVVVPLFADQFENGRRIADSGAGLVVAAEQRLGRARRVIDESDAPRIARGIDTVMATPAFGSRARRIADEMAATRDVDELLTGLLDPASEPFTEGR